MYLAYLDESGDRGWKPGASNWFVLSCMLIHETHWLQSLDKLIMLRQDLKNRWNIPSRTELKGKHFKSGHGALTNLGIGRRNRMNIYMLLI